VNCVWDYCLNINNIFSLGEDIYFEPDTAKITTPLIKKLLDSTTSKDTAGNPVLTYKDLSKALSQRQADTKATNPEFSRNFQPCMFGFGK
jgi:hypothetical protein